MNTPLNQPRNLDPRTIMNLPNVHCIRCGCYNFKNVTHIKRVSALLTGTGQEGHVNLTFVVCADCGWQFNPKELLDWENKQSKKENKETKQIELTESVKFDENAKNICRKCGEFYNDEHTCKGE